MRRRLTLVLQLALASVAVFAVLWAVFGRPGDEAATPLAASGAVAGASASSAVAGDADGGTGPAQSSFEPSSPAPIELLAEDAFDVTWRKPPRAALVFDVENGDSLYRRRATEELSIASLTKIMTALAVTDATRPDEVVRIPKGMRYEGSAVGVLPLGRRVRLEPLLAGLLIVSGNDAAVALADHVSGSERRFVAQASYRFPIKGRKLYLSGHNPLIRANYPGAIGLKTGYTDAAGRCFVAVARRHGRTFGVVLLDSPDPGKQAAKLLDLAFENG